MDANDKTFHFGYDERWRVIATYRESDSSPKEEFLYHCAGADGYGGSSYIDAVVLRDMDANTNWSTAAADGTMERRDYYCQNWRADVVCLISASGEMRGWVKYSAYGIPYGIPAGDTNGDGTVNSTDSTNINNWWGTGAGVTNPTGDYDLNGNINVNDWLAVTNTQWGVTLGWGKLSQAHASGGGAAGGNRKGYAGYEFDPVLADSNWHVRHRVLNSDLGRWKRRDPTDYVDGYGLSVYVRCNPVPLYDTFGFQSSSPPTKKKCCGRFSPRPVDPYQLSEYQQCSFGFDNGEYVDNCANPGWPILHPSPAWIAGCNCRKGNCQGRWAACKQRCDDCHADCIRPFDVCGIGFGVGALCAFSCPAGAAALGGAAIIFECTGRIICACGQNKCDNHCDCMKRQCEGNGTLCPEWRGSAPGGGHYITCNADPWI